MRPTRALAGLLLAAVVAGCGDVGRDDTGHSAGTGSGTGSTAGTTPATAGGAWLLRFNTAEGADGETSRSVYVGYDPVTGSATVRRMPRVTAGSSYGAAQALLISADRAWSLADTSVGAERARGEVVLYSTRSAATKKLPLRTWAGAADLRPVAAAFDPTDADLLRVVDSAHRVWKVDVGAGTATSAGTLPLKAGWVFGDGFDPTSGEPYVEAVDTEQTLPAGNGATDTRPVERAGGRLLSYDGSQLPGLPALPCGFAGGFTDADGSSWIFCADTPRVSAYKVTAGGQQWQAFGKPSAPVVPPAAAELAVVLPPA